MSRGIYIYFKKQILDDLFVFYKGILTIEVDNGDGVLPQPVESLYCVREGRDASPMHVLLGASGNNEFD